MGVLVPCRNEAAVIERKLANLAGLNWPRSELPHRVVVVDDVSDDETGAKCEAFFALDRRLAEAGVETLLVRNSQRPGKAGAIAAGLEALALSVDLIVLTDADVCLSKDALVEMQLAFHASPALGMATGAQVFVNRLPADGSCPDTDASRAGGGGRYDHWTSRARGFESLFGRLFSVHGQLLVWRTELELRPSAGLAADDLDLMLQVRKRGLRVERVEQALFFEVKAGAGAVGTGQALRRARAFVQLVQHHDGESAPLGRGLMNRMQWMAYRRLPIAAPWLALSMSILLPLLGAALAGPKLALAILILILVLWFSNPGRDLYTLMTVIAKAVQAERAGSLPDRWEMERS